MQGDDTKNLILAAVLSMLVVFAWYTIFPPAPPEETPVQTTGEGGVPVPGEAGTTAPAAPAVALTREDALAEGEGTRIEISSDAVWGSLLLTGGRIDDLHLSNYRVTQDEDAETVVLLNPESAPERHYIDYGWVKTEGSDPGPLPDRTTPWSVESGERLTPQTPVTLVWDNGQGLIFRRTIALDDKYMFSITQSVENKTGGTVNLAPFGRVTRLEGLASTQLWILHEGAIAQVDDKLEEIDYDDLLDLPSSPTSSTRFQHLPVQENGWLGFTDKYWMTSLIATPGAPFDGYYQVRQQGGVPQFEALMRLPVVTTEAGQTQTVESRVFAGAKEYYTLRGYEDGGIKNFVDAIDWGWFYFLTKPIFQLLAWVQSIIGNMGFAIITLTLIIKAILFPLAYKSYVSMSKMKKLQPEMQKIKERVGDDRQKMQQEMMALYKKEKVNPASGCLPILLQIPIFFSLYKVLFVTIEMRHAPFIGWITDLSAPDPSSWMNLFGALPWEAPAPGVGIIGLFSIGVYPIIMGISMWMQQKLNPAPTDKTQAMIFAWMPWVFMFMLGGFASGLVIYWCANNIITFTQQYLIMRSQGVEVDLLGNIKASFKKRKPEPEAKPEPKPEPEEDEAEEGSAEPDEAAGEEEATQPKAKKPAQRRSRKKKRGR